MGKLSEDKPIPRRSRGSVYNPRGNFGNLGRAKRRQRRRWFSRKYYASVMNLKEFYEDNFGNNSAEF